ncbi:helicase-associated domain-containing protein [uncultured Microbacterium sp.]|uniref:helicase-associated domain-containing protein n=1 Tax=uncultured Microbacterium sp. TaxID=191216 RepID=UPI0026337880|nr:helicase-associated domain-containing protein [uncultured Microbacterium sp.]
MSTHARPLAVWLAAAPDWQLTELFRARGISAEAPWSDFFDAAEALLDASSIERMLPQLTAREAHALRLAATGDDAGAASDDLISLALLRADGTPPAPVTESVLARPLPDPIASSLDPAAADDDAAHAAERAFTSVATLADVLLITRDAPLALLTTGALSAGERRRLNEIGVSADIIDDLLVLAAESGLTRAAARRVRLTEAGEAWLRLPASMRWAHLANSFRDALPRGLRTPSGGWPPMSSWPSQHPWDPAWAERSEQLRERARLLGLVTDGGAEPPWATALREGGTADAAELQRLLPTEVDRIFLQNDLSAIAPGPLEPALDVRLRGIAARESAAQASMYRFTAESVAHALALGETAPEILDFLGRISLTGIPQPLEYLVMQTAQRHGLVRVSTDEDGDGARVASSDRTLLDAMSVDQGLRPLAFARDGDALTSRVSRDTVYWSLTDARYPATIVDSEGRPHVIDRHPAPPEEPSEPLSYEDLIARLRDHQGPDADAAWLDRELEAAVRAKAVLAIEIGMPDGSTRELILEASGLGGGRLRGRDRAADVERTLPVRSIRSARLVEPAGDDS